MLLPNKVSFTVFLLLVVAFVSILRLIGSLCYVIFCV